MVVVDGVFVQRLFSSPGGNVWQLVQVPKDRAQNMCRKLIVAHIQAVRTDDARAKYLEIFLDVDIRRGERVSTGSWQVNAVMRLCRSSRSPLPRCHGINARL